MSPDILLIEDEQGLASLLSVELKAEGYDVVTCHDGMSGLIEVRRLNPSLLVLDWGLPYISGPEICRRLRHTGSKVPIILLTARDSTKDRVLGLDSGADDYVAKPFSLEELLARIRSRLRYIKASQECPILHYADIMLKQDSREVFRGSHLLKLTMKEFELMQYFMRHAHHVLSHQQIISDIWGCSHLQHYNVVHVHVSHLRSKMEQHNARRLLHTIRGYGYVLR